MKAPLANGAKGGGIEDGMFRRALYGDPPDVAGLGDNYPKQNLPFPAPIASETGIKRRGVAVITGQRLDEGNAGARLSFFAEGGRFRHLRRFGARMGLRMSGLLFSESRSGL